MRRILVHESLSGGDPIGDDATCAALLPQGRAMRNALLADLLRVPDLQVTTTVGDRPGASSLPARDSTRLHRAARRPGESAEAFIARLAPQHDLAWVIAPESGGLLERLHDAVDTARWVGCSGAAIAIAASKQATSAALATRAVATPLSSSTAAAQATRWVVKPDDGAGAVDTQVHASLPAARADAAQRQAWGCASTLEPWVEGETLSLTLLAGPVFVQLLAVNRQRIEIDADGRLAYCGVQIAVLDLRTDPRAPVLRALALDVAHAMPGLRGIVGVDLVWHAQLGPVVIEVNPRVTCAYVGLSAALHRSLAAEVLAAHALPLPASLAADA